MKCSTIVRGKAKFAKVTENQLKGCLPLTFPASSLIMLFPSTSHHKPTGLHPAPPATDTYTSWTTYLPQQLSLWKSCRFKLNLYFLQEAMIGQILLL